MMRSQALLDVGLGCRVLQKLDMDAEYEGNVEAVVSYKSLTWRPNLKAMSRPPEKMLNMRATSRPPERISWRSQLTS